MITLEQEQATEREQVGRLLEEQARTREQVGRLLEERAVEVAAVQAALRQAGRAARCSGSSAAARTASALGTSVAVTPSCIWQKTMMFVAEAGWTGCLLLVFAFLLALLIPILWAELDKPRYAPL